MKVTDNEVKEFMSQLLDGLNKQNWGTIEPQWLVADENMEDCSDEYIEEYMENHLSLFEIFKTTLKNFK